MAKFRRGQSGNPGGRPKEIVSLKELARTNTPNAIRVLLEVMNNKNSPAAARVSAACALLDRGYGKPAQTTEISGKEGSPLISDEINIQNVARRIAFALALGAAEAKTKSQTARGSE